MGTDIHTYVEIYKDNKWIHIDKISLRDQMNEYYSYIKYPTSPYERLDEIYYGRNYCLFGILTGGIIRSSYEKFLLNKLRGLPDDISDTVREIADFELDHSPSWITLEELEQYKWRDNRYWIIQQIEHFFRRRVNKKSQEEDSVIIKLRRIKKQYKINSKQIRIVFWFDS